MGSQTVSVVKIMPVCSRIVRDEWNIVDVKEMDLVNSVVELDMVVLAATLEGSSNGRGKSIARVVSVL